MRIQLFDEAGVAATEVIDYEDTIWAEGQLDESEQDTIEHLEVGETACLNYGWKVHRVD